MPTQNFCRKVFNVQFPILNFLFLPVSSDFITVVRYHLISFALASQFQAIKEKEKNK